MDATDEPAHIEMQTAWMVMSYNGIRQMYFTASSLTASYRQRPSEFEFQCV